MSEIILVLMFISVAISAYARARREGTWSWPQLIKTLLWLWGLGAVVGGLGVWLGRLMGPEHALMVTLLVVLVIAAGVVVLTLWLNSKMRHDKR